MYPYPEHTQREFFLDKEQQKQVIELFNFGYGYRYIARKFHCRVESLKAFKYRQKKKGVFIKDLPNSGGIQPQQRERTSYHKLFYEKTNVDQAIELLNGGATYQVVGEILGCDRTTILSFHHRQVKEGKMVWTINGQRIGHKPRKLINYNRHKYVVPVPVPSPEIKQSREQDEHVTLGRKSYKAYAADYEKEHKEAKKRMMKEAKERIAQARLLQESKIKIM